MTWPTRAEWLVLSTVVSFAACSDGPLAPEREPLASLPTDLAAVVFTAKGQLTPPYVLLHVINQSGFRGFVAIGESGEPVWFFRTLGNPAGATRRRNGNFVFLDNERGILEVTPEGSVVRELAQQGRPGRFIHHDVTVTPTNSVLFIAEDARLRSDTLVVGDAVWEWFPESDSVAMRWSSYDELLPESDRGPRSRALDWIHANSVSVGPTGRVLVSSPFLNQVLVVARDYGGLEMRIGGIGATVPVDDPFSGQHTATEVAPGRFLVFDNGFERTTARYSRAVEYRLQGDLATKVWEWKPERTNWSPLISSAWRLPNGNTLVGFGLAPNAGVGSTGPMEVYEVTAGGRVVWHAEVSGAVNALYRATPVWEF